MHLVLECRVCVPSGGAFIREYVFILRPNHSQTPDVDLDIVKFALICFGSLIEFGPSAGIYIPVVENGNTEISKYDMEREAFSDQDDAGLDIARSDGLRVQMFSRAPQEIPSAFS